MIKLFTKFFGIGFSALAAFCATACTSDNPIFTGTAEEPNQFALNPNGHADASSSSTLNNGNESSSSSNFITIPGSGQAGSSSSSSKISTPETSSSSSDRGPVAGTPDLSSSSRPGGQSGNEGSFGHAGSTRTLDDYLKKNNITEDTFDDNVLAYNKTFQSCDTSTETCIESPGVAEYRTQGLHKVTEEHLGDVSIIFPTTALFSNETQILKNSEGCSLYVLNIKENSPALHILTKIAKDSIYITNIHDKCDYEQLPFDIHVGFLFEFCNELSAAPEIVMTNKIDETMKCGIVTYEEYTNKKLLTLKISYPEQ